METHDAAAINREYYERTTAGRDDYWRKMAAPRHRVEVMRKVIGELAPGSVVDLGCGNGVLLTELRDVLPNVRWSGLDLSRPQVAQNVERLPWATFRDGNLEQPFPADFDWLGQFDVALATEVIEHLDAPGTFLENAARLLRPGGHLVLSTQSGPIRETEQRVGHRRHYSRREMEELLGRHHFKPVKVWNTGFPFHDLSKWYANLNPDGSMAQFGEGAYGLKEDLICSALRLAFSFNSRSAGAQLFAIAQKA